jgi:hypothetical protein
MSELEGRITGLYTSRASFFPTTIAAPFDFNIMKRITP